MVFPLFYRYHMMMVVEQWFGVHSGETIGRGLLAQILRDCQITRDEFKSLLRSKAIAFRSG
jgi:hypothetical protein